ncbi:MAG: DUF799 family lipoprotein [Nitrospirota bacterium]|jgi:TolB-like protein
MHKETQGGRGRALYFGARNTSSPFRPALLAAFCLTLSFVLYTHLLAPAPASAEPEAAFKIAVFPFDNLSEDVEAQMAVMPVLREQLAEMGLQLADEAEVNRILFRERVRRTSYLSSGLAGELREDLGAEAIFLGCIFDFIQGETPQIGLTARLVETRSGRIIWAGFASAKGTEFAGLLGLGEIKTMDRLVPEAVERLLDSFSSGPPPVPREQTYKIAVMPFKNNTEAVDADIKATYLCLVGLFKSSTFEPLEYGEIREAMVRSRIKERGQLDYETLEALSSELNVDGILLGTLESYPERQIATVPPKVEMTVRLLEAGEKRILWYDSLLGVGEKVIIFNSWDPVKPADETAYKVISKLVKRMENLKWR